MTTIQTTAGTLSVAKAAAIQLAQAALAVWQHLHPDDRDVEAVVQAMNLPSRERPRVDLVGKIAALRFRSRAERALYTVYCAEMMFDDSAATMSMSETTWWSEYGHQRMILCIGAATAAGADLRLPRETMGGAMWDACNP